MTPWIKMRVNLRDDPRVRLMARQLCNDASVTRSITTVTGALYSLWALTDQHSTDGELYGYTKDDVDDLVGLPGFCESLAGERVRWLEFGPNFIRVLKFDEHNGDGARGRAQTARRVADHRARNGRGVTTSLTELEEEEEVEDTNTATARAVACPEPAAPAPGPTPSAPRRPRQAAPAAPADDSPVVLAIPCTGSAAEWQLHERKLGQYAETFPDLDVLAAIRAARQWVIDNPTRRKTHNGTPAFLTNWLTRSQNRGEFRRGGADGGANGTRPGNGRGPSSPFTPQSRAEQLRDRGRAVVAQLQQTEALQ